MALVLEKLAEPVKKVNGFVAQRVLDVVDCGLVRGVGKQSPGKMCVEAAVCYAMGMPHGDEPICVNESVRDVKINLNDALPWKSSKERAAGLREISVLQLGSNKIDGVRFTDLFKEYCWKFLCLRSLNDLGMNPRRREAISVLLEFADFRDDKALIENLTESSFNSEYYDLPGKFGSMAGRMKGQERIDTMKAVISFACLALRKLKSPGVKLWNQLPPKVRNKKLLEGW